MYAITSETCRYDSTVRLYVVKLAANILDLCNVTRQQLKQRRGVKLSRNTSTTEKGLKGIRFMACIKLQHVSAPRCHAQGIFFRIREKQDQCFNLRHCFPLIAIIKMIKLLNYIKFISIKLQYFDIKICVVFHVF